MKIYSLSSSEENIGVQLKSPESTSSAQGLWFESARPIGGDWAPVEIEVSWFGHYDGQKRQLVDFPNHGFGCLVFSAHAKNLLSTMLSKHGEFLPLNCSEGSFWAFHVTTCIDAIDIEKSTPLYADYKGNVPAGNPISITTPYAFHCNRLVDIPIFCVPNFRGFFMTEILIEYVTGLPLRGFTYKLEFDSQLHAKGFDYLGEPIA